MKKLSIIFGGTLFLALFFSLTAFKHVPPGGPSANGQGSLTLGGDQQRRFSFHANNMPDGSVQGSGVLTYTTGNLKIKFDIDCLSVSGNTATMSGTITDVGGSNATAVVPGWKCWFKVKDNGEGSNASPDEMSLLFSAASLGNCGVPYSVAVFAIEGGNIQVKP